MGIKSFFKSMRNFSYAQKSRFRSKNVNIMQTLCRTKAIYIRCKTLMVGLLGDFQGLSQLSGRPKDIYFR